VTSYGYDAIGRLTSLGNDLAGTSYDQSFTFSYNPAGQIVSRSGSNDNYAWTGHLQPQPRLHGERARRSLCWRLTG
jgi:hypothetical protein